MPVAGLLHSTTHGGRKGGLAWGGHPARGDPGLGEIPAFEEAQAWGETQAAGSTRAATS